MAKPNSKWYKLDSAGTLYSALQKEEYSAIYRFSALMEKDVDPAALQRAIDRCMPRFPTFAVRIRKGAFWYYLEHNSAPGPFLKEDVSDPCQPVRFKEDNGWLVRFYYYRNRISIEVFHALSDGGGAIVFFRTLLAEYLRQTGVDIPAGNGVLDLNEPPREEEMEDAYARYAGHHALGLHRQPTAYQNTGTSEPFYTFHVTMGFVPLSKLREESKKYGASITEYLSAVLIYVILEKQKREKPYRLHGVRPYSCTYTNPGAFTVPPEMAEHIRGAEVILGQATVPRCHCASISYGDTMEITFAGTQAETDTERDFFRFLVRAGIPVRVESNR